ncbi:hypothetical protein Ahy_B05g075890 [Arachis hypogaea]|uniref:Uncharacterized protein n=1 Tax=Arachis hypogaea TaxID=3818 RepID=A0A444Z299_ARAHY|nr:hypothetical protein Ahy_B05g075890 [Arachis hypogaea]
MTTNGGGRRAEGGDLESILEEQSERDENTQYVLHISHSEGEWSEEDDDTYRPIHCMTTLMPQQWIKDKKPGYLGSLGLKQIDDTPRPHFSLRVMASKYDVPIKTIALLDTGSCATVVKPNLLPSEAWIPFNKKFTTTNKETFTIDLISKKKYQIKDIFRNNNMAKSLRKLSS